ncbi:hypothetical protein Forpe1208_v017216 [Fusarium oxysporum f. sp. rapae]|uniref:Uncharacterized protein n=1 Tax=Fusarium oxysporum f. sp. rapae TaxID=485398 RepID=A0A8J5NFL4_FUSOX|nr:hypothetical protein Forpe1208_v017216 [Fusarium oxysporum f. sp. rapae]
MAVQGGQQEVQQLNEALVVATNLASETKQAMNDAKALVDFLEKVKRLADALERKTDQPLAPRAAITDADVHKDRENLLREAGRCLPNDLQLLHKNYQSICTRKVNEITKANQAIVEAQQELDDVERELQNWQTAIAAASDGPERARLALGETPLRQNIDACKAKLQAARNDKEDAETGLADVDGEYSLITAATAIYSIVAPAAEAEPPVVPAAEVAFSRKMRIRDLTPSITSNNEQLFNLFAQQLAGIDVRIAAYTPNYRAPNGKPNRLVNVLRPLIYSFKPSRLHVNGITAAALVMRQRGDLDAMVQFFKQAPVQIASDIRNLRLGRLVGVEAAQALLRCLFGNISDIGAPETCYDETIAACDILVAHLRRNPSSWPHIHPSLGGPEQVRASELYAFLGEDLAAVLETNGLDSHILNPQLDRTVGQIRATAIGLEAAKAGIIYGALLSAATELKARGDASEKLFRAGLTAATDAVTASGSVAATMVASPIGAAAVRSAAKSLGNLAAVGFDRRFDKKKDAVKTYISDVINKFNIVVIGRANWKDARGFLPDATAQQIEAYKKVASAVFTTIANRDGVAIGAKAGA